MIAQEFGDAIFRDFACSHTQNEYNYGSLVCFQTLPMDQQKHVSCKETRSLVSVRKRMVANDAVEICCGKHKHVGLTAHVFVNRAGKG